MFDNSIQIKINLSDGVTFNILVLYVVHTMC